MIVSEEVRPRLAMGDPYRGLMKRFGTVRGLLTPTERGKQCPHYLSRVKLHPEPSARTFRRGKQKGPGVHSNDEEPSSGKKKTSLRENGGHRS